MSGQGDATYLIVKKDGTITDYGLNAVCTHLGCVVPWNSVRTETLTVPRASDSEGRPHLQSPAPRQTESERTESAPLLALSRTRTSSSARATGLSTTTRARSSAARPRW